jgi:putative addiction module component (TIGR02574 family)
MSQIEVPAEILALPIADRLELVAKIWDSIDDAAQSELSEEQRRFLEERLAAHRADTQSGISWDELKDKLLQNR